MQKLSKLRAFSESWTGTIIIVLLVIFFFIQAFTIPSGSMKNTLLVGDFLFVKKFSYGIPTPHIPWLEVPVLPDFDGDGHLIKGDGPKRGDIVVFRNPQNTKIHFVKRCVAVGGDEVVMVRQRLFVRMHEGDEFMRANYAHKIALLDGRVFVEEPFEKPGIYNNADLGVQVQYPAMQARIYGSLGSPDVGFSNAQHYEVGENAYFMMGDNRNNSADSRYFGAVEYKHIVGTPWFSYFSWDEKHNIRWERIGKSVKTLENSEKLVRSAEAENARYGEKNDNFDDGFEGVFGVEY